MGNFVKNYYRSYLLCWVDGGLRKYTQYKSKKKRLILLESKTKHLKSLSWFQRLTAFELSRKAGKNGVDRKNAK